ncbi:MAG: hypothetical protein BroJett029_16000 [Alphaproteobacteria bacterium]|nr:MAG: hypothetical protein BroJett029_16000 [Alphaproteobacteria bacterium]
MYAPSAAPQEIDAAADARKQDAPAGKGRGGEAWTLLAACFTWPQSGSNRHDALAQGRVCGTAGPSQRRAGRPATLRRGKMPARELLIRNAKRNIAYSGGGGSQLLTLLCVAK